MKETNDLTTILKKDLISYLNIDILSEEVALFNTTKKIIKDIYFTKDSLIIKTNNNTIKFLNGATSTKDIDTLKGKTIVSKTHLEYVDDFIIYKYKIKEETKELQVRCLKSTLENSIQSKDILLFYTYTMFFRMLKDITINKNEVTLTIELIDNNIKEYNFKKAKLKDKNNYIKGYFKNELIDFNLIKEDDNYKFYCHIYKDNKNIPFLIEFNDIKIIK